MALSLDRARAFLAAKRIAVVGVSRNEKDFSRIVFHELLRRGHDVAPVNPALTEVEGRRAWAAVSQIEPPVEAVLILTPRSATEAVVRDAIRAGVRKVWLHRGAGVGSGTPEALALCEANGIEAVHDLCPFMAFPDAGLPHSVHGFFRRRFGRPLQAAPRA
jgi:predicted CoA-binding protein